MPASIITQDDSETGQRLVSRLVRDCGVDRSSIRMVKAPYRICPLGAHIDHQLGPVTAMAIDRGVLLAYAPQANPQVWMSSLSFPGEVRFGCDDAGTARAGEWGNYVRGAVHALAESGHRLRRGLVGVTSGSWSEGGLASSAAMGVACLLALEDMNNLQVTARENILLDQVIENKFLGLRNGILDQSAILLSRKHHLALIDCRTIEHGLVPPPPPMPPWAVAVAFSGVKKALVGTGYNQRVSECEEAARILLDAAGRPSQRPVLGHVHAGEYAAHRRKLEGPPARRAAHFFSEVDRVRQGVEAWRRGDLTAFGRLMTASGGSSIRNYECGCKPLIDLYEVLVECPGVYGARFSGAGFRGCCVALIASDKGPAVVDRVQGAYARRQPALACEASVIICQSDDGARLLPGLDSNSHTA